MSFRVLNFVVRVCVPLLASRPFVQPCKQLIHVDRFIPVLLFLIVFELTTSPACCVKRITHSFSRTALQLKLLLCRARSGRGSIFVMLFCHPDSQSPIDCYHIGIH